MFNRVNAFLEAIDKKTEEMADAADEEDVARAIQQQQEAQQQQRLRSSGVSSSASSVYHGGGAASSGLAELHAGAPSVGLALRDRSAMAGMASTTPPLRSSSVSSRTAAQYQQPQHHSAVGALASPPTHQLPGDPYGHAGGAHHPVLLPLPSKLPSFRPSPADGDEHRAGGAATQLSNSLSAGAAAAAAASPSFHENVSLGEPSSSPSSVNDAVELRSGGVAAAAAAVERLQTRCKALEAEKTRWQQEAAAHKAQCSTARDALWKAEQEARSCRAAQRDAEQALAVYKETSQRLLEEAQQEVRRATAAATSSAAASSSSPLKAPQEELAQAREQHQRLELLQAEHAALLSEVDRYQQDAAKAAAELQRVQETRREALARVDALTLDLHAARESLEGEVAAHAETKSALRRALTQQELQQRQQQQQYGVVASTGGAASDAAIASMDVMQLQSELREAKQRQHMLTLQLSNKQTVLDSAEREVADLKARYNDLARQVGDAEVEMAAGFRSPAAPTTAPAASSYGGAGPYQRTGASVTGGRSAAADDVAASNETLKRSPAMLFLARRYSRTGRAVVTALCAIDAAALRLGRALTQTRWVWRVIFMGYLTLLQLWVVLLVIAGLVAGETELITIEGQPAI